MPDMNALQSALKVSAGRTPQTTPETVAAAPKPKPKPQRATGKEPVAINSREGKDNIAAWLPGGFKRSIRLVQAKKPGDPSLQELMAEAFNDLFSKYNVPTVSEE